MSRAIGGARPWSESAGPVGQRHMPPPPISALIDAPRQSNFRLRASFFVAIITTAATPDYHPDCRALLLKIVALHAIALVRDLASHTLSKDPTKRPRISSERPRSRKSAVTPAKAVPARFDSTGF